MVDRGAAAAAVIAMAGAGAAAAYLLTQQGGAKTLQTLQLSVDFGTALTGEAITVTVKALDASGSLLGGVTPTLESNGSAQGVFPATSIAGVSTLQLSFQEAGTYLLQARSGSVQSNGVNVTVTGSTAVASMTLSASATSVAVGQEFIVTATALSSAGAPIANAMPVLLQNGVQVGVFPATGASGTTSLNVTLTAAGTYQLQAQLGSVDSNAVSVTASGGTGASISITASPTSLSAAGGTVTVAGQSSLPGGTTILIVGQGSLAQNQVTKATTATASDGSFSLGLAVPANTQTSPVVWSFVAYENANQLVYSNDAGVTQAAASAITATVSQPGGPGTPPQWAIRGLTPSGAFTVYEQVESVGPGGSRLVYRATYQYTAGPGGNDARAFNVDGGVAGNVVSLLVTDLTSGEVGGATYTLQ